MESIVDPWYAPLSHTKGHIYCLVITRCCSQKVVAAGNIRLIPGILQIAYCKPLQKGSNCIDLKPNLLARVIPLIIPNAEVPCKLCQ